MALNINRKAAIFSLRLVLNITGLYVVSPSVDLLQQCIQWIYSVSFTIHPSHPLVHLFKPASIPSLLWPHSLSRQVLDSC